jgi:hypothetical protein
MTASPRDLDKKFQTVDADTNSGESVDAKETSPEVPMIVHREQYMEGSVAHTREHRVPLADWADYEREHGF